MAAPSNFIRGVFSGAQGQWDAPAPKQGVAPTGPQPAPAPAPPPPPGYGGGQGGGGAAPGRPPSYLGGIADWLSPYLPGPSSSVTTSETYRVPTK